jgi:hypothetical protein
MENPNYNEVKQFKDVKTKTDSKLEATQRLFEASHRLNNIKIELELYTQLLDNKDSTHRKLSDIAQNIHKSIVSAISKLANVLKSYL